MKKLRESLGAKIVFGVMAVICFAMLCMSSVGLFVAAEENYYQENVYGYGDTPSFEDDAFSMGYSIAAQHLNDYEGMSFEEYTSIYDNWYIRWASDS